MRALLASTVILGLTIPALAHHGWGPYDADSPLTISGPIDTLVLQNPHGEMTVAHDGEPWLITLAPLSRMTARGATADIVKTGEAVVAYGYPRRDGTKEIRAEWIEIGGQRFQLR